MARNFKPTLPQPPKGFEDRVINGDPRPVANDGSLMETRVWYANQKYYGSNIGKQDDNLCDRVKKVKKVINTTPHTIADYPGESAWFLKETAWTYLNAITLYLADGASVLVQAPAHGAYHNTIEYSVDKYNWAPVVVGQSYTGKLVDGFSGKMTAYNPITKKTVSIAFETERDSDEDLTKDDAPMYAWEMTTPESEDPELAFTDTKKVTTATHLWAYNEEESTWVDMTEMAAEQGGSITIQSFTYGAGGELYLRGSLYSQNDCCPMFGGTADAIEKIEGNLAALVDWKGHNDVPSVNYQFSEIFKGCTALTDASKLVLPSELSKSATHVYARMFKNCTALVVAPNLSVVPVGTANNYVFSGTFNGCTALEVAPALPAVDVLPEGGFYEMFIGCTHLSSITAYIGSEIKSNATYNWLNGAGTAVNGQCTFNHSEDTFRWRYPSKSGIPGPGAIEEDPSQYSNWVAVPTMATKLYFSAGEGGSVQAIYPGIVPTTIYSGESVEFGSEVNITAVPDNGYVFAGWTKNTTGTTATGAAITIASFPYGRYEDGDDKIEAVASFTKISNLSVHYNEPPVGYTSDLAFVRNPDSDTTRIVESGEIPMYAWSCIWFGDIYTESEVPPAGYNIWTVDQSTLNWQNSTASYIRSEIFTKKISVLVFDDTQGTAGNITVLADGSTFRNWNRQYCACTATPGSNVTVTVALAEGEDLGWEDGVTANPRTIVPVLDNFGVTIRRVPSQTVTFSCTHGSVGATVDGIGIQSGTKVAEGKSVVFTITPDEGYQYTGTNPETVEVSNSAITKNYVCTAVVQPLKFVSSGTNTVYYSSQSMKNFSYSLDGGTTWNSLPNSSGSAVSFGTSGILIKGSNSQPGYQCNFVFGGSDNVTISGDITCLINGTGGLTDISTYANAFRDIFKYNTNLVDASGLVLPTILSSSCFNQTFQGCTALTTAPSLPATTLADGCYYAMFSGCSALATAPTLPATTLVQNCYKEMFYGCTLVNEIHCAATDISASSCTANWLHNTAASGNFYGKTAAGWGTESSSGIPSGWTAHLD